MVMRQRLKPGGEGDKEEWIYWRCGLVEDGRGGYRMSSWSVWAEREQQLARVTDSTGGVELCAGYLPSPTHVAQID